MDRRGQPALTVVKNPPTKKVADVSDLLATLVKETVLTQIQRSQLDGLFAIANNCAHPKEAVRIEDVERLIRDGHVLASTVLSRQGPARKEKPSDCGTRPVGLV